jgi:hypothetical protein
VALSKVYQGPASAAVAAALRERLGPAAANPEVWVVAVRLYQEFPGTLTELAATASATALSKGDL